MKKIYFSALAICINLSLSAQQTIGFENVNLVADSSNNGSDGSGGFYENGVVFTNDYFANGDYFGGFAVSNRKDSTTSGYGNQFSAIPAKGASNSVNYGIYNPTGKIEFAGQGVVLHSFQITNTTYAALSMKNGDSYGKKFGSLTDTGGNDDGTNGEDFFRVWIYAHNESGAKIDSTVFYLADFRFTDNSKDYIVKTWETVDLSFIKDVVYSLSFNFESSDMSFGWINTPAYFAIDNLKVYKNLDVEENALSQTEIYPNPFQNNLIVKGNSGSISINDLAGKLIYTANHQNISSISTEDFPNGIYFLTIENENGKFSEKIVK